MFKHLIASLEDIHQVSLVDGDYGTEEEAGYADPGYQADKKPRYPLKKAGEYDEERIRAAWNYIHKAKNRKPYTASQLKSIEGRIITAWKAKIDKKGPPSAVIEE